MKTLYIVRHGIAQPTLTPDIADESRQLTDRGRKRIRQVGHGLSCLDIHLERIASSPLPRASQTAEILADELDYFSPIEVVDALRVEKSALEIAQWLSCQSEESIMLVGHNPNMSELVGLLTLGEPRAVVNLRRGGIAVLSQKARASSYRLDWVARPRLLRRISR